MANISADLHKEDTINLVNDIEIYAGVFVCEIPGRTLAQRQAALANEFKQRIVSSEQTKALLVNGFGPLPACKGRSI
jgi:hypothetical protein